MNYSNNKNSNNNIYNNKNIYNIYNNKIIIIINIKKNINKYITHLQQLITSINQPIKSPNP